MCGLCAAYNANRGWTDLAGKPDFAYNGRPVSARVERGQRVWMLSHIMGFYGLSAVDWGGGSYLISNAAGRNVNVYNLSGIWTAVDQLMQQHPIDPLQPDLIQCLERAAIQGEKHED
jgi:hypothetical protein